MARECFEDAEVAQALNESFVSVKVDREERPDIDSVYMRACMAFTGSGGWPLSAFLTPDQRPFFAGTYFPKTGRGGMTGFLDLLDAIRSRWADNRQTLLDAADAVLGRLSGSSAPSRAAADAPSSSAGQALLDAAAAYFSASFDAEWGGFGAAPKFPMPHVLTFLLTRYEAAGDQRLLAMAEKTLEQMYRGGLFDHIGYGFSRYSTDRRFLIPHFEKMLYDNALLIVAYAHAFRVTGRELYQTVAFRTADYLLREMTDADGGFYSAQDADSDGVEGKYYVFTRDELCAALGPESGEAAADRLGIAETGNFTRTSSVPNLLASDSSEGLPERWLRPLREYRRSRARLRTDDKVLTAWNALAIAAFAALYRTFGDEACLRAAEKAWRFIEDRLCEGDTLFVGARGGRRTGMGFLDDYAFAVLALLNLYEATLERRYLDRAVGFAARADAEFLDQRGGGYFLYGKTHSPLVVRPKETYDGALPSGNGVMAYNLVRLSQLPGGERYRDAAERQLRFLAREAQAAPAGHTFFLQALSERLSPPPLIVCAGADAAERARLIQKAPFAARLWTCAANENGYSLLNGQTTYYVCAGYACRPPTNDLGEAVSMAKSASCPQGGARTYEKP